MSLITHWGTRISVYKSTKIPKPPGDASVALYSRNSPKDTPPDSKENDFVSRMYHTIDRSRVPVQEDFEVMVMTSANVKDKFKLLKDVQDGQFCDIVAQIVRPPYDGVDKITLWVSDYTENTAFYNFSIGADAASLGRDGDPWGYLDKFTTSAKTTDWPGPFGKRSMQITCWEPWATVIREENMRPLTWIDARNIQIKMSRNGANLEGYLREDRSALGTKFGIHEVDLTVDPESINHHVKAALQRKREYERLRKEQLKDIVEASKAGEKRKKGVETNGKSKKDNARSRRDAKRKKGASRHGQGDEQTEDDTVLVADLNTQGIFISILQLLVLITLSEMRERRQGGQSTCRDNQHCAT